MSLYPTRLDSGNNNDNDVEKVVVMQSYQFVRVDPLQTHQVLKNKKGFM